MDSITEISTSKGRASWTWQKMHAMCFDTETAKKVMSEFGGGGKLYPKLDSGLVKLMNSAGCFVHQLYDDNAPYIS